MQGLGGGSTRHFDAKCLFSIYIKQRLGFGITDLEGMEIGVDVGSNALDIMLSPGQARTAKSEVSAHKVRGDNKFHVQHRKLVALVGGLWTHFRVYSAGFLEITLTFMAGY